MQDNQSFIRRCFGRYLIPSIMAILGGNISIMIDNIIAGRVLGSEALAAMSIVNPVFFILTTLGTLVSAGSSSQASVCIGKEKQEDADQLFTLALTATVILGAAVSVVGMAFLSPIVSFTGASGELRQMAFDYCKVLIPGGAAIMAVYLPLNYFRIEGIGQYGMYMFFIMSVLDIVMDLLFTIVIPLGMSGMALATVLSSLIGVICVFPFLFTKAGYHLSRPKKEWIKRTIVTGSPLALNNLYAVLCTFSINSIVLSVGGAAAVACFAFSNSVSTIANAVVSGISQTVSPMVGVFYGEDDVISVKRVVVFAMKFGIAVMAGFTILIIAAASPICSLFGITGTETRHMAVTAVRIYSLSLAGALINNVFVYYFMTVERTKISNVITALRGAAAVVIPAFFLSKIFGLNGVWASFLISEICAVVSVVLMVRYIHTKEKQQEGFLLLNYSEYNRGRMITFTVENTTEAIMESSVKINDFCEQCCLSPKQAMIVSLSIEEILVLMCEHVFEEEEKKSIDVRVCVRDDVIIMRFRFDGKRFNPIEYYKESLEGSLLEEDSAADCLGLRLITNAAKDVRYTTALGVNNMIIRI